MSNPSLLSINPETLNVLSRQVLISRAKEAGLSFNTTAKKVDIVRQLTQAIRNAKRMTPLSQRVAYQSSLAEDDCSDDDDDENDTSPWPTAKRPKSDPNRRILNDLSRNMDLIAHAVSQLKQELRQELVQLRQQVTRVGEEVVQVRERVNQTASATSITPNSITPARGAGIYVSKKAQQIASILQKYCPDSSPQAVSQAARLFVHGIKAFVNERMLQANFCSLGALFSVDSADQTVRTCHLPSTIGPFSKLPGEFQNARCHLVSQANEFAKQQCKYIQQQLYTFVVRLHQPATMICVRLNMGVVQDGDAADDEGAQDDTSELFLFEFLPFCFHFISQRCKVLDAGTAVLEPNAVLTLARFYLNVKWVLYSVTEADEVLHTLNGKPSFQVSPDNHRLARPASTTPISLTPANVKASHRATLSSGFLKRPDALKDLLPLALELTNSFENDESALDYWCAMVEAPNSIFRVAAIDG
eukprot:m.180203 g.180203  ORF g.180203 m.180203 type:complete len:473 (-) comp16853_c0_seq2:99-1517(-)